MFSRKLNSKRFGMFYKNTAMGSASIRRRLILLSVVAFLLTGCSDGTPDNEAAQSESAAAPGESDKSEAFISDGALNAAQQAADALENESMHRALQIPDGTGDTEAERKKHQEVLRQAADEAARAAQSY
jgi:hydroxypyruvate isomerase